MSGRALFATTRAFAGVLALVLLTAVPGVAIASLPSHPSPTHECCAAPEAMPPATDCGTAPCCIQKPAPRTPSVATASPATPALAAAELATLALPAVPRPAEATGSVVPRARSAPLHILLVTLLI